MEKYGPETFTGSGAVLISMIANVVEGSQPTENIAFPILSI
jgi:hypothetical protein